VSEKPEAPAEETVEAPVEETAPETPAVRRRSPKQILARAALPTLVVLLVAACGFFLWQNFTASRDATARTESVQAAREITVSMLTYQPDTIDEELSAARERLSGAWKDQYGSMVDTVIAPEAKAQGISAAAEVAASASVSAEPDHAVVLLFVNQTVAVGTAAPTVTPSSVRVTLDKIDDQWTISEFQPV
jgi:Mce-associated membrane protein